jgi:class 3 adenylate cyclase
MPTTRPRPVRAEFSFDIAPIDGGGVEITARSSVVARGELPERLTLALGVNQEKALVRYLDAIERVVGVAIGATDPSNDAEPAVSRARRVLYTVRPDGVLSLAPRGSNSDHLAYCAERFGATPVAPDVRAHLLVHLADRPDDELTQMRPFELARTWGIDRRAALAAFLHATRAGLVDLRWQLSCPICRVASDVQPSLADVKSEAHCEDCQTDYAVDFAANVEAVFQVNRAIRPVEPEVYCAGSPWFRPHVFARLELPAHTRREIPIPLPAAPLYVRVMRGDRRETAPLGDAPATIEVTTGGLLVNARASGVKNGAVTIENVTDTEVALHLERSALASDVVLGTELVTMSEFHDLFATEAPATGVDLSVGAITILFSDLTGTTSLYEELGDAKAFALVETHFQAMAKVIAKREGAIVKTMGDAIMATFRSPAEAASCALDMIAETHRLHGAAGPMLRVGVHHGACLAVRANGRLDFFGNTVNTAARLQGQARGEELVLLADLLAHPDVQRVIDTRGLVAAHSRVSLKGLKESRPIVSLRLP